MQIFETEQAVPLMGNIMSGYRGIRIRDVQIWGGERLYRIS